MPVLDFKNPDWYAEEDINMFRDAVHKFYAKEMAPHSEEFRKNKKVDRKYWKMAGDMGLLNCAKKGQTHQRLLLSILLG